MKCIHFFNERKLAYDQNHNLNLWNGPFLDLLLQHIESENPSEPLRTIIRLLYSICVKIKIVFSHLSSVSMRRPMLSKLYEFRPAHPKIEAQYVRSRRCVLLYTALCYFRTMFGENPTGSFSPSCNFAVLLLRGMELKHIKNPEAINQTVNQTSTLHCGTLCWSQTQAQSTRTGCPLTACTENLSI